MGCTNFYNIEKLLGSKPDEWPFDEDEAIAMITEEFICLVNEQYCERLTEDSVERNRLAQIERDFLRILDTTTLTERLFQDGPREHAIEFGSMIYCATDGKTSHMRISWDRKPGEECSRDMKPGVDGLSDALKNIQWVRDRDNKIPTPEEVEQRRRQRHLNLISDIVGASKEIFSSIPPLQKDIKPDGAEPKPGEPKLATFVDQRAGTTEKVYIKEVKPGFYERVKEIDLREVPRPASFAEEHRLRALLRQIKHFPQPHEVMRTKGNEWLNYAQALERTIETMREIAAKVDPF